MATRCSNREKVCSCLEGLDKKIETRSLNKIFKYRTLSSLKHHIIITNIFNITKKCHRRTIKPRSAMHCCPGLFKEAVKPVLGIFSAHNNDWLQSYIMLT